MAAAALAVLMAMAAAGATVGSAAPPPVPPPVTTTTAIAGGQPNRQGLGGMTPGPVRCDGGITLPGTAIRRPVGMYAWPGMAQKQPTVTLRFDVDPDGRPISITREGGQLGPTADLVPALAATRFAAGARTNCAVTFTVQVDSFSTAPVADLVAYSLTRMEGGRLPPSAWARIYAAGDCATPPRPAPLVRAFPDFDKLPATPGVQDWTLITYDINAGGKPVNVRPTMGTGNRALDAAAVKAIRQSRFTAGARKACAYPFWRQAGVLAAPPMPDSDALRSDERTCPSGRDWAVAPALRFPQAYARRSVEGWAIVRYDVAPWGQIGNASVLAAQPSEDFGKQAVQVIQSARLQSSPTGRSGCVDRIRFAIRPDAPAADDDGERDIRVD